MKFDTMINLALAAIVFKLVYDANKAVDNVSQFPIDFINENIVSTENPIYTGASNILSDITGDKDSTIGTAFYDWVNY